MSEKTYDGPYMPSAYMLRRRVPNCKMCGRKNPWNHISFCSDGCRREFYSGPGSHKRRLIKKNSVQNRATS